MGGGRGGMVLGGRVAWIAAMAVLLVAVGSTSLSAAPIDTSTPVIASAAGRVVADAAYELTGTGAARPDAVGAAAASRRLGERVEVLSERSETSRAWALPEGGFVAEQYAGEVRFRDAGAAASDGWRDIDTTLVRNVDGTVSPKAVPDPMVLTGAGRGRDLVTRADRSGATVVLDLLPGATWPEPVLEGASATYRDVLPGVDVRVDVRPDAVSAVWLITSRTGIESLFAGQNSSQVRVPARVKAEASTFRQGAERVELIDAKGNVTGQFRQGHAWDANGAGGESTVPVDFTMGRRGSAQLGVDSDLVVGVDRRWLTDAARVFPITIDPDFTSGQIRDVYVRDGYAGSYDDTELRIGYNGSYRYRSFVNFNRDDFLDRQVTFATFQIWNKNSYAGCTKHRWELWESDLFQDWHGGNNQPARRDGITSTDTSLNTGSGSCNQNWVSLDTTWVVRNHWATGQRESGIQIRATDEGALGGYKRFRSSSATWADGSTLWNTPPRMVWGYNDAPGTAGGYSVAQAAGGSSPYSLPEGTLPTFRATLPDAPCYRYVGSCLRMRYDVYRSNGDGWDFLYDTYSDFGAGGVTVSAATPTSLAAELRAGFEYRVHAVAYSVDVFNDQNAFALNGWNSSGWRGNVIVMSFYNPEQAPTAVTIGNPPTQDFSLVAETRPGDDGDELWVTWNPTVDTTGSVATYCWSFTPGTQVSAMACTSSSSTTEQLPIGDVELIDQGGIASRDVYILACPPTLACSPEARFTLYAA